MITISFVISIIAIILTGIIAYSAVYYSNYAFENEFNKNDTPFINKILGKKRKAHQFSNAPSRKQRLGLIA